MPNLQRTPLNPEGAPAPLGLYSQAMKVSSGSLLYVAGQVGIDADGNLAEPGDIRAQTRQTFKNIGDILAGAGAGFSNVVEFTTYLVGKENIEPYIAARTEIYPGLFPDADYPPNTLLVISGLVKEEFLLEIKCVAALP
ncbi:2-iminobutanoate/2-iminopropanoate deaminase [Geodia barretti]|uniref:2-iminobutanoate/2-iminopropanoate deaminase n=1 Tax=Geodia barretti TaxID=519541 RepID=A0AA35X0Q4_GEOBA|nr:2-iminobutanoate/2-iminopropanoate deaminase [Geodia barretti]